MTRIQIKLVIFMPVFMASRKMHGNYYQVLLKEMPIKIQNCCYVYAQKIYRLVLEMGFQYGTIWTGERNIVVLFKKYLTV
ncbi:MAG: hypothetical protein ACFFCZ_09835 [Promethearchaeota archaeon]